MAELSMFEESPEAQIEKSPEAQIEKSKTQVKQEAKALQVFGEQLTTLSASQLAKVPLAGLLLDAIGEIKNIQGNTARKRHIQRIGNLLRHAPNLDDIQHAYQKLLRAADLNSPEFKLTEEWRDRLLTGDKQALTEFIAQHPCDIQQLRVLIRQASKPTNQAKKASTTLFRFIRDSIL